MRISVYYKEKKKETVQSKTLYFFVKSRYSPEIYSVIAKINLHKPPEKGKTTGCRRQIPSVFFIKDKIVREARNSGL